MKKYIFLFVLVFSLPIFSQNAETSDSTMINLWNSLSEEERSIVYQAFFDSQLQEANSPVVFDEAAYLRGKKRLRIGVILTSAGIGTAFLPFAVWATSDDPHACGQFAEFLISGMFFWPVSAGLLGSGIPITIRGARLTRANKPQFVLMPNGINFSMEF